MSLKGTYDQVRAHLANRVSLHEAYVQTFESPQGMRVLRHIMKIGHVTSSTLVSGDPTTTAHNEGRRNLALSILRFVKKDHEELLAEIEKVIEDENT